MYTSFFLVLRFSSSSVMGQVWRVCSAGVFLVLSDVAALTILWGVRLLWIDSAWIAVSSWLPNRENVSIGATAAILVPCVIWCRDQPIVRAGAVAASCRVN